MNNYDLTFVHLNDIHGRVTGENNTISFAKLFTFLENLRNDKKNGRVFLIDSGDTIHGTSFANLSKGESIVELFNSLKFDYVTLGNHDFNYGYEQLMKLLKLQNYKTLGLNFTHNESPNEDILQYDIIDLNGSKICFFGVLTPETYYKTNSKNIKNMQFLEPEKAIQNLLKKLENENIKFYVAVTHLGCDVSSYENNTSFYLAEKFPEINLILDGHSHTTFHTKKIINKTLISQTGNYNNKISIIKVKLDLLKNNHTLDYKLLKTEDFENYKSNITIENKMKNILKSQENITNTVIGKTLFDLIGEREVVRSRETNFTQLITDAILWKTGCDAVLINGGSIRDSIKAGDIRIGDVVKAIPFGNYIVTKMINGEDLIKALENGLKAFPNSLGGMAQVAGLEIVFDSNKEPMNRIERVFQNKTAICLENYYNIAMTDFIALGGEEYSSFVSSKELKSYPAVEDIVIEYIKLFGVTVGESIHSRLISKASSL
ncbi:MAG: bifunctional metallophosphatase/5'-nucleotidase [Cetobacterium sp.]